MELAPLHKNGIITTLPSSKYESLIFAQRKPNGKLRLLVDLGKINTLIRDDYINNNHSVSTLTDAVQNMAGKTCSAMLIVSKRINAFKWPTSNQSNTLHSILQVEHLHTEEWHKDLVVPLGIFELNTRISRCSHRSRSMCTICRQYWHSRQYPSTFNQKPTSSFSLPEQGWP